MKKLSVLVLVLSMLFALVSCGDDSNTSNTSAEVSADASVEASTEASAEASTEVSEEASEEEVKVMTYAEFVAAEVETEVCVETYVQAKQSWWDNKGTFYTQNEEGAYFLYEMPCNEEEYNQLTVGTKIRVTGFKVEWSGEVEIIEATFEILEGNYVAEPVDVTELLGTDELIEKQNQLVSFTGLTVAKVEYKNDEPGDDIYVTVSKDGEEYDFCVEVYLTGVETDVYKAFETIKAGDVVDIEGFLYWYNGVDTHITAISVNE